MQYVGRRVDEIAELIRSEKQPCPFCGRHSNASGKTEKETKPSSLKRGGVARQNATSRAVDASLLEVAFILEREQARGILDARNWIKQTSGTTYVVGSGGSFSVASYVSYALNCQDSGKHFAHAVHPLQYLRIAKRTDAVIVISYSGRSPDCRRVIEMARQLGVNSIALITGDGGAELAKLVAQMDGSVFAFPRASGRLERGFVSVLGTLGPCASWCAAMDESHTSVLRLLRDYQMTNALRLEFGSFAKRLTPILKHTAEAQAQKSLRYFLSTFGSGCAVPAMIDFESKFTEGDLGWLRLHDEKDFSHGRFMSALTPDHLGEGVVLYKSGESSAYSTKLEKALRLRAASDLAPTLVVSATTKGRLGALELLLQSQFLVRELAVALGKDISRPGMKNIPKSGLSLYRWRGQL